MTRFIILSFLLIGLLVGLVYGGTLHHSFHFDDIVYITDNPTIKDIHDFKKLWRANIGSPARFIAFYSFALQQHFHKDSVISFHIVNIFIHFFNGLLVFWLARLVLSSPGLRGERIVEHKNIIALTTALLFVAHPMQTQAITYIVQRFASLATMFYILSVCLYLKGRMAAKVWGWFLGSALAALFGMFTKQITLTLPLAIVLVEFLFLRLNQEKEGAKPSWIYMLIPLLFLLVVPMLYSFNYSGILSQEFQSRSHLDDMINSRTYFLTQFPVVTTYVRLLLIPLGQNLDYDFHASEHFFQWPVFACFSFLLFILLVAFKLSKQYRVIAFGIFWFFLCLLVESSIIPIPQVIFEHRCYLPSAGFFLALASGFYYLMGNVKKYTVALMIVVLTLSYLAYERNKVWESEVTLWADVVEKSPDKIRPLINLGIAYVAEGVYTQGVEQFDKALIMNPTSIRSINNRGIAYKRMGNLDLALADFNKAMNLYPKKGQKNSVGVQVDWAEVFMNRAEIYRSRKQYADALKDYEQAIMINPRYPRLYQQRGFVYESLGRFDRALADYDRALSLDPQNTKSYLGRGVIRYFQKDYSIAIVNFDRTIDLAPELAVAYFYRSLAYDSSANPSLAKVDMAKAEELGYKVNNPLLKKMQQRILEWKKY